MREDDENLRHYVPLLRRVIILVAVIIAVPVMLWTITVFVRTYVGPPRVPTFHQLAATASINAPTASAGSEGVAQSSQGTADGSGQIVTAGATVADASDSAAAKGSMLGDRSADPDSAAPRAGEPAGAFPPSPLAAADGGGAAPTPVRAGAGTDEGNQSLSSSQPLSGPIPLPRRRPREAEMLTADNAISDVPIPRRRPEGAGSSAPAEATGSNPIGFIQNLFH